MATASSGPASAARLVLSGPPTAEVTGSLRGPTFVFTDADFGAGPALVAPGVDQRPSIHGEVRVTVENRLFASWSRCPDSTHTVQGPPAATGWPWATSAGVLWGHPGTWTFKLDASANRLQPGSLEAPCTNHLVGFDLVVPDSATPQR